MLADKQVAASADALQPEYFRGFLEHERSELAGHLATLTRRLTECMMTSEMTPISHVRRAIRGAEGQLRVIDRMMDALEGRFPEEGDIRRRA